VFGLRCDVTQPNEVEAMVSRVIEEFGRIDILVNNSGTTWAAAAEDVPLEGWRKVIDVNLTGVFLVSQAVGRTMIARRSGKIINIASIAAFGGHPQELHDAIPYTASKGGVLAFTADLAVKWARYGIAVNAIAPGWFPTDLTNEFLAMRGDQLLERIPLRRFGSEDELKGAIAFLASSASDYVTGHTLTVDGGYSA
jgi:gluconate 5-dehydrogenase